MVSVGTIIWLSSELMFFAGLFAMYFTVRAAHPDDWPMEPTELNVPYALVVTIILVSSSVTCQIGVFAAERGDVYGLRRWFLFTFVLGLIFVLGQANEYRKLVDEGTTMSATGYGSVFYLTTGFHGLHVIGGLHRLHLRAGPLDHGPVHAGPGHRGDRRLVLLALRRRRLDRAVRHDLPDPVTGNVVQ